MSSATSSSSTSLSIVATTRSRFNSYTVSGRTHPPRIVMFRTYCSDSKSKRGFGTQPPTKDTKKNKITVSKEEKGVGLQQTKEAPGLSSQFVNKTNSNSISKDIEFEERLEAVRRSALEQKKTAEKKLNELGPIDYDAPPEAKPEKIGFGTKIGIGAAVIVFGLVFALGDFIPSGSVSTMDEAAMITNNLSDEEKATLQNRLKQFEETLSVAPKDSTALEGAAVTLAELGEYPRAASLLQELTKDKPSDPDAFRLLGEVKYGMKDYEGSVAAYKMSAQVSKTIDFEVLRGLTNSLLADGKPNEAVQVILASRERLRTEKSKADSATNTQLQQVDPIQVELLLGKAYSDWGHISDSVSVYDGLISSYPEDFRGYLAKGIILKQNGNLGDAERMFIQARFFASDKAKALVDRYSRR